jgi:hypothetical protein
MQEREFHARIKLLTAADEIAKAAKDANLAPEQQAAIDEMNYQLSRRDVYVGDTASSCSPSQPGAVNGGL